MVPITTTFIIAQTKVLRGQRQAIRNTSEPLDLIIDSPLTLTLGTTVLHGLLVGNTLFIPLTSQPRVF